MGVKAIGLLSGGLDSTLAVKMMMDQGIEVLAVNFNTGFCLSDTQEKIRKTPGEVYRHDALKAGEALGVAVEMVDIYDQYWDVLTKPKHGYGSAFNPCLDCRSKMLSLAGEMRVKRGAEFVFTGEVMGQRPMSQYRAALRMLEKESNLEGLLLRPLSAKLLEPSIPEQKGWVDREKLLDIVGRGRKVQMRIAEELGITDYPSPAGGCCSLVDKSFAERLRDLFEHRPGGMDERLEREEIFLLKTGRHFRISPTAKLIVARDEGECRFLHFHRRIGWRLEAEDLSGPVALLLGEPTEQDLLMGAAITASYGKGKLDTLVPIRLQKGDEDRLLEVAPMAREESILLGVHA